MDLISLLSAVSPATSAGQSDYIIVSMIGFAVLIVIAIFTSYTTIRANKSAAAKVVTVAAIQAKTASDAVVAASTAKESAALAQGAAAQAQADAASAALKLVEAAVKTNATLAHISTVTDTVHKIINDMNSRQLRMFATAMREISDLKPGDAGALKMAQVAEANASSKEHFEEKALAQRVANDA